MQNKPQTILSLLAATLISCALFCPEARAVPIDGTITFLLTSVTATQGDPNIITFGSATTLFANGDYSVFPTPVTFQSISFSGSGDSATLTAPITLWEFTQGSKTYSFDLLSLDVASITSGSLALSGSGIAGISGMDDTVATFAMSSTSSGSVFEIVFGSTSASGTAVPDGGTTVALLGFAFVGVEALRKKLLKLPRDSKTSKRLGIRLS